MLLFMVIIAITIIVFEVYGTLGYLTNYLMSNYLFPWQVVQLNINKHI